MLALKSNDFAGYARLLRETRSRQVDTLLRETDECLRKLLAKLLAAIGEGDGGAGGGEGGEQDEGVGGDADQGGQASVGPTRAGAKRSPKPAASIDALSATSEAWNAASLGLERLAERSGIEQPRCLEGGELRPYQLEGLRWLAALGSRDLHGILADEMGLGKTVQVIALLCWVKEGARGIGRRRGKLGNEAQTTAAGRGPSLVVVPASLVANWQAEFQVWSPKLRLASYVGPASTRDAVYDRRMAGTARSSLDVVLTTYETLLSKVDSQRLARIRWRYLIVDEGHRLKNAGCKLRVEMRRLRSTHRLLLTGTPLQNDLGELWSLLNFLVPEVFDSSDDFAGWFGKRVSEKEGSGTGAGAPAGAGLDAADLESASLLSEEETLLVTTRLHQVLRPFVLRRLKSRVAAELPKKHEVVIRCQPSPYQRGLSEMVARAVAGGGTARGHTGGGRRSRAEGQRGDAPDARRCTGLARPAGAAELAALAPRVPPLAFRQALRNPPAELRTIANHPMLSCLHAEGSEHLLPPSPVPAELRLCGKAETLDRCLVRLHAGGHRVLLFSTQTGVLDLLEEVLRWRGWGFLRLDGATAPSERGDLVRRWNVPGSTLFVFLLSVRAGGVGLNLQTADTVVMYDTDWNAQIDAQAQARAHRLGQTREVLVVRLVEEGEAEERVQRVVEVKKRLAERSITYGFFDGHTSSEERAAKLLGYVAAGGGAEAEVGGHTAEDEGDERGGGRWAARGGGRSGGAGEKEDGGAGGAGDESREWGGEGAGEDAPGRSSRLIAAAASPSDDALDRILARTEDEIAVFAAAAARAHEAEREATARLLISSDPANEISAAGRVARSAEVAGMLQAAFEAAVLRNTSEVEELGRGKRRRTAGSMAE